MPTDISREKRLDYNGLHIECDGLIKDGEEVATVAAQPTFDMDPLVPVSAAYDQTEVAGNFTTVYQAILDIRDRLEAAGVLTL